MSPMVKLSTPTVRLSVAGGVAGLAYYWLLNLVSVRYQENLPDPRLWLVVGAIVVAVGTFGATRYPLPALAAGMLMTALVVVGWLTESETPMVAAGRVATDIPSEAVRHGAFAPLVVAGAVALVGAALGSRRSRHSE